MRDPRQTIMGHKLSFIVDITDEAMFYPFGVGLVDPRSTRPNPTRPDPTRSDPTIILNLAQTLEFWVMACGEIWSGLLCPRVWRYFLI